MGRIQQLPSLVVNKIAAGEVIERPASVVKELLENSVDAGARRVDVEVENGGADLIRVVDDGHGIDPEDLLLAFANHATSKLRGADELFQIATMGFRGEALASIGGVAQVSLQSRQPNAATGAEITCNGGDLSPVRPWNGSPGTRIEVRHLFYNTPVRRKFLRTPGTEIGHIAEACIRISLPHARLDDQPGLHLTLRHNNKLVHDVPASANLLDRIGQFFGPEVSNSLYAIHASQGNIHLSGYVANPDCERGTARMQYLFLNGRWIRDRTLAHALQEAYRGLLMTGRYAVAFLFLDLQPDLVDVNVHPTKTEVRFRESQVLHHLVFQAVRERLRKENLTPRLQMPSTMRPTGPLGGPVPIVNSSQQEAPWSLRGQPGPAPALPFTTEHPVRPAPQPQSAATQPTAESPIPAAAPGMPLTTAKILQLYDSYIVLETEAGMLVIDQHALHERVLFEQLKQRLHAGPLETQRLLIPEPVELTADQAARTLEYRDALHNLGLDVEDFGGHTILVTGYPALLGQRSPASILQAIVDHLMTKDRTPSREVLFNDLLSLLACHAAVRAGERLTAEQMDALVQQRHLVDDTHHCPHGRPTALLFSRHDLERQFGRV